MDKLSNRELSCVASLGTLWGISEITLGFILHNAHVPFTGLIQTYIGTVIALTALKLTGKRRSLIYSAIIAAVLKMLSFSTIKIFPFIGILLSAITGQAVISVLGANLLGLVLSGGAMCCWPFAQSLLFYLLAYSSRFLDIYQIFLSKIGLVNMTVESLIIWIFTIHFLLGMTAAGLSWRFAKSLRTKLGHD